METNNFITENFPSKWPESLLDMNSAPRPLSKSSYRTRDRRIIVNYTQKEKKEMNLENWQLISPLNVNYKVVQGC